MSTIQINKEQAAAARAAALQRFTAKGAVNSEDSVRDILGANPMPDRVDPLIAALQEGCDPDSAHQVMTLAVPVFSFLARRLRVVYNDGALRWVGGQSWQMGGSGCGKSLVLRSLERLLLSREMKENDLNAREAARYSMLSEKERKETPVPQTKVHVMDSVPTAIALLQQMQVNGDGCLYCSCSEAGELAKKIGSRYYSLVLDMLKKSYDGTGESYLHKTSERMYYVPSMKLCCNIGGTIEPMFRIFRHCNADGTLSRGSLTILPERKDEKEDGAYKAPSWTAAQKAFIWAAAERLRSFDNRYMEDDSELHSAEEEDRIHTERLRRALSHPDILALGREIKAYLAGFGEEIDDCCSRADERAMGYAYLLYVAGGCDEAVLRERTIPTVRWWVKISIDCAYAMQMRINVECKSHKEAVRQAFKTQSATRLQHEILEARERAFALFEEQHEGEEKRLEDLAVLAPFARLSRTRLYHLVQQRGYSYRARNLFVVTKPQSEHPDEADADPAL